MTRETKIGIALMVLLVGVFGAIAYKKWNSRKPTAVAAAAVEPDEATADTPDGDGATDDNGATVNELGSPTPAPENGGPTPAPEPPLEPTPAPPANPFDVAGNAEPDAGAVTDDPFAGSGFVRNQTAPEQPAEGAMQPFASSEIQPVADAPPAQAEPIAETDSPFAMTAESATAVEAPPISDSPFAEPAAMPEEPATATVLPAGSNSADPFAEPAPQSLTESPEQPAIADDPFGTVVASEPETSSPSPDTTTGTDATMAIGSTMTADTTATTGVTEGITGELSTDADPAASAETTVVEDDPFAQPATVADGSIQATPATSTMVAGEPADDPFAASSAPMSTDDPFAAASEPGAEPMPESVADVPVADVSVAGPAATTGADVPPGRFPEGTADPVADAGSATAMQDSPFGPPEQSSPSKSPAPIAAAEAAPEPFAPPTAPQRQHDHYVVTENDSYWSISKRVYGTPTYYAALARFNSERVPDPNRLKPGMKILTPPPQELSGQFPKLVSSGGSAREATSETGFRFDEGGHPTYRVGKDDTLTDIAHAHLGRASRWVQIYEMNRKTVPDPKSLKPGTVLRLPEDASRVRLVPER